jgi:hypothetical protein
VHPEATQNHIPSNLSVGAKFNSLLEGSGVTLRDIYKCSEEAPKQPKQTTCKLNDGSDYIYIGKDRLPAELRKLSADELKAREVAIQ